MRGSLFILLSSLAIAADDAPKILQRPAISDKNVAFVYAGDIWVVSRGGGEARRLTTGVRLESHPVFSPDGSILAFAGEYDGNLDVYTIATNGGEPTRLTYHPDPDLPVAFTPDGSVVFRSTRSSYARFTRLYTLPVAGGHPSELALPMAEEGSYSPDGQKIAYVPFTNTRGFPGAYIAWKRYRGGSSPFVWIADLATSAVEIIPRTDSNDFNPMWVGSTVYFLSDRDGPTTLYAYDLNSKQVKRLFDSNVDIKSASACADAIAFDRIDGLYLLSLGTGNAAKLEVTVRGDLAGVRPRLEKVGKNVQKVRLSPTGARVVLEARGDVLTVPAEKGDSRNLTSTPGVADRDPAWSPDGQTVAYFSDSSGEYELHLRAQNGLGEVKKYQLGDPPSFYYEPTWSPDGKRIAYGDKRRNLWVLDLESGESTKVDTNPQLRDQLKPSWSPDGKWIAYARGLNALPSAVFLYSIETGQTHQITDGMSDVQSADFDKGGKHLYFTASTDFGPLAAGSMASFNRAQTSSVYLIVLDKRDPSPLAPESDDEKPANEAKSPEKNPEKKASDDKEHAKRELPPVTIDLENIDQRIVPLPLPNRNYTRLIAGKPGTVYLLEGDPVFRPDRAGQPETFSVTQFDLKKRKPEKLVDAATQFILSLDGEKMLYRTGPDKWFLTASGSPAKHGEGAIKLEDLEVRVEPRAEWEQIYRETWRIERDFLYDPNAHGLDLAYAQQRYAKYVAGLGSRYDLSVLMEEMLGELCLGHVYVAGGDMASDTKDPKTGLLGADYAIENGRYKFAKIYRGEGWNPDLRAPLLQPGTGVNEGEYLLAVNGREVRAGQSVYQPFDGTASKQTAIRIGPNADGTDAREVTVVPIPNERQLRNLAWVEANRKKVDQLSGGKVAYIYLPNTSTEGFARFNRYFFAQTDKHAAVIDERFNGGGQLADHIIDYLAQPLRNYLTGREGEGDDQPFPRGVRGPKVMIINERAGSGGDYLPYTFRQANLGPLVGKRTWGGLVGIGGYPTLIDGGTVTAPRMGIWFPNGRWDVENRGVSPDVEVEFDPQLVRQGKDPQLEKAVALVLESLEKNPTYEPKRPAFPNYYRAGVQEPAEGK